MLELLFYSLVGGLFSLIFAILLLLTPKLTQKIITPLVAFGAGAFLGAVFFDILPEAVEMSAEPQQIFLAVFIGFVSFFILERSLMRYSKRKETAHQHSEHAESLPILVVIGDGLHNFLDGIIIGLSYLANPSTGLISAIAIAAHEIPQEIGDFSILVNCGWKRFKILQVNITQSLTTVLGAFLAYGVGSIIEENLPILLGTAAGIFLYISASNVIPELHHKCEHKHIFRVVLPLILGAGVIYLTTYVTKVFSM